TPLSMTCWSSAGALGWTVTERLPFSAKVVVLQEKQWNRDLPASGPSRLVYSATASEDMHSGLSQGRPFWTSSEEAWGWSDLALSGLGIGRLGWLEGDDLAGAGVRAGADEVQATGVLGRGHDVAGGGHT